jgi:hypothetical protein
MAGTFAVNSQDVAFAGRASAKLVWHPGPEFIARRLERHARRFDDRIGEEMRQARHEATELAGDLGRSMWVERTGNAEDSFVARIERIGVGRSGYQLRLAYGANVFRRGFFYGFALEAEQNQYGGFDHPTAVLEETLLTIGQRIMDDLGGSWANP